MSTTAACLTQPDYDAASREVAVGIGQRRAENIKQKAPLNSFADNSAHITSAPSSAQRDAAPRRSRLLPAAGVQRDTHAERFMEQHVVRNALVLRHVDGKPVGGCDRLAQRLRASLGHGVGQRQR